MGGGGTSTAGGENAIGENNKKDSLPGQYLKGGQGGKGK